MTLRLIMPSSSESDIPDPFLTKRRKKRKIIHKKASSSQKSVSASASEVVSKITNLSRYLPSNKLTEKSKNKKRWKDIRKQNQKVDSIVLKKSQGVCKSKNLPKGKGLKKLQLAMGVKCSKDEKKDKQAEHIHKLQEKLNAARFRYLNEKLYTETGQKSYIYFQSDKEAFKIYHSGFQSQVKKWPVNPLEKILDYVRQTPRSSKVVDFGCGEALLAQNVPHEVFSYDLVALNKHVTACDMAHVPLKIASMDTAVFCLSLMGTNMVDYIAEAARVLKHKGILLVAEVVSRFKKQLDFVREIEKMGFSHLSTSSYKLFVIMKFMRDSSKPKKDKQNISLSLKPCVYKKR
ncbi:ribosomal RNA-processing protein 8-like isoform X2 [Octopus sinensis]|uniref:Ribosomal RNA-processing protein 8 n=1 Tax=Octopus sinensis TaxID=2607531 RepID=A0A7E6F0Y1_9MOLL|nr:ribosomal RNA-processing protein 8-like isoform X2 [Octopus sinensis]